MDTHVVSDLYFGKLDYQDDEAARVPGYLPALDEFSNAWDALRGRWTPRSASCWSASSTPTAPCWRSPARNFLSGASVWAGSWSWSWPPNTRWTSPAGPGAPGVPSAEPTR